MSPEETERTMLLIKRIAAGRTVILVEHKMKVVMEIADRITVLHHGDGPGPRHARRDPRGRARARGLPRQQGPGGARPHPRRSELAVLTLEDVHSYYGPKSTSSRG